MLNKCCVKISDSMTAYADCPEKKEWLAYGLELIIGEFLKFGLLMVIASFMGISTVTALILATALPYRVITGGGHSTTYLRCSIITILVYLLLSLFANSLIAAVSTATVVRLFPVIGVLALILILLLVPQEKNRKLATLYLVIWIVSCILVFYESNSYKVYLVCSMVGVTWQTIFITPAGSAILKCSEKMFDILSKKEVQ